MNKIKTVLIVTLLVTSLNATWLKAQIPVMVKDIVIGSNSSSPQFLKVFDNHLYFGTVFTAGLWKSDGTTLGTVDLDDLSVVYSNPSYLKSL